jgi:hypothetical protein
MNTAQTKIMFGDEIRFRVSPGIIIALQESLEEWVVELSKQEDIADLSRETFGQTQKIIRLLHKNATDFIPISREEVKSCQAE